MALRQLVAGYSLLIMPITARVMHHLATLEGDHRFVHT